MDILTIGTALVDYIIPVSVKSSGKKLTFEKGKKYEIHPPVMRSGGGALNVAVTCARAGKQVMLTSEWGSDAAGSFLERSIRAEGITPRITVSQKQPTGTSFVLVSPDGERTVLVSRGALNSFSLSDIPAQDLQRISWAYIVTGSWSISTIEKLLRVLSRAGISTVVSPSGQLLTHDKKSLVPIFSLSDVVIMNRSEAALVTGIRATQTKTLFKELDSMVRGIVVMTDSSKGVMVSDGSRVFSAPAFDAHVIDETGAGDAFGGAFMMGLIESGARCGKGVCSEEEMIYALRRGSANAASVIEHMGATEGILTKKQFLTQKRWRTYPVKIIHLN